jgi:hypothetical protein
MASSAFSPKTFQDFFQSTVTIGNSIDARTNSNFLNTGSGSRTITVTNIQDGKTIAILCPGQANDIISIVAYADDGLTPLTVKYGAGQNGTMASTYSLFTLLRVGGSLNWVIVGPIHGIS